MPGLKACLTCGALTKKSYCVRHQKRPFYTKASQRPDTRPNRIERGYDADYQRLKREFRKTWVATYGSVCAGYNRRPHTTDDLTVDHIIPLKSGGLSVWDNLQCLCRSCNSSKGAR